MTVGDYGKAAYTSPQQTKAMKPCILILLLWMMFGASHAWASSPPSTASEPSGYQPPVLKNEVTLTYPEELLEQADPPQGQIIIKYVVDTQGIPKELEVQQSLHPALDALAMEAVQKLRYEPGQIHEKPVEVVLSIGLDIAPPVAKPPIQATDANRGELERASADSTTQPRDRGPIRIQGRILTAGDRTPVVGLSVVIVPTPAYAKIGTVRRKDYAEQEIPAWSQRTTTQDDGTFEFRNIPSGKVRIIVLSPGYERLESIEQLGDQQRLELKYFITPKTIDPYRTVVRSKRDDENETTRRTISVEEINALPGTQGDALKSIQNFPGIARAPFGAGLLVIRGSAPGDSATYLAGHEIPQLFHFGGITSVFNSDILTQIDFIPGNFDSRYGDAIGGIINVAPRKGRRDGFHGYIDSDLFDTGVLFEGPIGKGSFILSGRRSYIDFILPRVIPEDAGLNFTLAPRYYDYQALFDYPISGGDFSVRVFGSDDRSVFIFNAPNETETDDRNRIDTTIFFHRVDLSYRKKQGPWEFLVTPSYRRDFASLAFGDTFTFDLTADTFSGRAEIARSLSRRASVRVGTEFVSSFFTIDVSAPPISGGFGGNTGSTSELLTTRIRSNLLTPALYTTFRIGLSDRLTLFPGARVTFYGQPFHRVQVDPRLRFTWQLGSRQTFLKGGLGIYTQAPNPPFKYNETFGNPNIGIERSVHASLGVEHEFPQEILLGVTGFYKYLWDLSAPSENLILREGGLAGPEFFATTGMGHIYGAELLLRKSLTRNLFGWLSYTLMRSIRRDQPGQPFYLFDFDQTHILTLIASYKLPQRWQIGARFRLVSGNPSTPVQNGLLDASEGSYIPLQGPVNSDRLPAFHQLDIRVDKRWIFKRVNLTAYLDVLNVYNRQNPEGYQRSYNFQQQVFISSLPILPSIGLKLAW